MKVEGLAETEAWSGNIILQKGWHEVVIDTAEEGQSSGGHPEIAMQLTATDGGGGIRDWVTVTAKTVGRVKQLLEAAGVEVKGDEFDPAALVGKKLAVYVQEKPARDDPTKTLHEVASYKAATAGNGAGGDDPIPF